MTEPLIIHAADGTPFPNALPEVRRRLAERETAISNLQPQIARSEQFANELRGKLFTAQAQHAELTDLLKSLETVQANNDAPESAQKDASAQ